MAKSVRYSWANGQKPFETKTGHLVVTKAVTMIINKGIEANLVSSPARISEPHIISKVPVKYDQNAGCVNPICRNLPGPSNERNKCFCIPSDRKISPTASLTNSDLLSNVILKING